MISLKGAYRLGVFDAITGHAELYDGYHAVMQAHGFDLDQARAYFQGAEAYWKNPVSTPDYMAVS